MKKKKIIIAGGTGFLGRSIADYYKDSDYQLYILSRNHQEDREHICYLKWDGRTIGPWARELEGAEALINLSGKSVDCRYTQKNKQEIYDSRLEATEVLGHAISLCRNPPEVWINASSATIYRHSEDRNMDEAKGELGKGFSVDVCRKWESCFMAVSAPATRKVILRIAIVLGKNGGALQPLRNLVRAGMGGKQGNGRQYFSWIHEQDFVRIIDLAIQDPEMQGIYNTSAPDPVANHEFMKLLRQAQQISFGIPLPEFMLKAGSILIGTEPELILKSRRVVPKRLENHGFVFQYPKPEEALKDLV